MIMPSHERIWREHGENEKIRNKSNTQNQNTRCHHTFYVLFVSAHK